MSPDIAECLDALCADSNLPLPKLAEAQDHCESGVMAPLFERSETVADALRVVLMFNWDKRTLQRRFARELSRRFSDLDDDVRVEMCLPLLERGCSRCRRSPSNWATLTLATSAASFSIALAAAGLDPIGYNRLIAP